jgi:hypothetical protein
MKTTLTPLLALGIAIFATAPSARAIDLAGLARASLAAPETLLTHREALGLSSDQEMKIKGIRDEAVAKAGPLEAEVKSRQNTLESTLKAEGTTFETADESLKALIEAESALKSHQLRTLLALRDTLTPEQLGKAVELTRRDASSRQPLQGQVKEKAGRLKATFDDLKIEPNEALKAKGKAVEELLTGGDYAGADKALDELITETGLNEPAGETPGDFSGFDAGATDLDSLKQRIADVEAKARALTRLPVLRQLLGAKDDLEAAKAAEDATQVGRILTWAEGVLK